MVLNLVAIVGVLAYLARLAWPPSEAVRIRNALLLDPTEPANFEWTPPAVPEGFRAETQRASTAFSELLRDLGVERIDGDWERALAIAAHLTERAADKGAIQADLATTYRAIREGRGYCADFARIFLALAHAAGLAARQWSFSFDGFGGHGHVVSEIYDRKRGKWLFLDVYNNFHAADAESGAILSALEFRDAVLGRRGPALMRPNGPGRPGYEFADKALDYYRRGADEWYLLWGNDVFTYEATPVVAWSSRLSGSLGQLVATLLGVHPRIRVLQTPENAGKVLELARLGRRVKWLLALLAALALALAAQVAYGAAFPKAGT
jgi:hypothetical protein